MSCQEIKGLKWKVISSFFFYQYKHIYDCKAENCSSWSGKIFVIHTSYMECTSNSYWCFDTGMLETVNINLCTWHISYILQNGCISNISFQCGWLSYRMLLIFSRRSEKKYGMYLLPRELLYTVCTQPLECHTVHMASWHLKSTFLQHLMWQLGLKSCAKPTYYP